MRNWRVAAWASMAAVTVACGSGSSPSAPSGPSSPTGPTTPTTVTSGVFTFTFAAGTNPSDQSLIQNAVTTAAAYFQTAFGRTITQPTTITGSTTDPGCANPGSSAFTGMHAMTICVANMGWSAHNTLNKQKILMHELFHALCFEMRWLGHQNQDAASAHWIDEGTAEYVGWRSVANTGAISFDAARACMVAQANAQTSPGLNLVSMETAAGFGTPGAYQVSMLGIDELATPVGAGSLMTYGNAIASGAPWQTAFQAAWGTSTTAFYAQYVSYRASLGAGADTCGT